MIELNKIYNESNCETMSRMPDNFVDLTVTSPPYDNLRLYEGYEWDFERVAQELFRVTKQGGVVVWVVNDATVNGSETLTSFKQAIYFRENCGFNLHDTMIYQSDKQPHNANRYEPAFEYMFVFSKGAPKTFNGLRELKLCNSQAGKKIKQRNADGTMKSNIRKETIDKLKNNIWKYQTGGMMIEHPAIFPERLAQDHILSWSNEREIIYDPFMGSGTVAKICIACNRNYIGSEISQKYCDIAERRLQPYKSNIDMFYEQAKNTA